MIVSQKLIPAIRNVPILLSGKRYSWILLALCLSLWNFLPVAVTGQSSAQASSCNTEGSKVINIACDYVEAPVSVTAGDIPKIVLNRAVLSFKTNDENDMRVELTFTNRGKAAFSTPRPVYLGIDDDAGHNLIRRPMTRVDFRNLVPGKPVTFLDHFLIGTLRPGHYLIHLWIPSPGSSAALDATQNLMLSNVGVPDRQTGLNTIGAFSVVR